MLAIQRDITGKLHVNPITWFGYPNYQIVAKSFIFAEVLQFETAR
jgi:hypothetical protein